MYIDWDYIKNQSMIQTGKKNLLGDAGVWLHLVQFMDFGALTLPLPVLQARCSAYVLHSASGCTSCSSWTLARSRCPCPCCRPGAVHMCFTYCPAAGP